MQIVVKATAAQKAILLSLSWTADLHIEWYEDDHDYTNADAYIDCCFEDEGFAFTQVKELPVFVNAVSQTCRELPINAIRINGWISFLNRPIWEVVGSDQQQTRKAIELLEQMGRKAIAVPDEPGMIAARVVAMIINEAYFALGEDLSSKTEIDTAMKLGTNYPYGPFEWAGIIGVHRVAKLLETLSLTDDRYALAPTFLKELANPTAPNL